MADASSQQRKRPALHPILAAANISPPRSTDELMEIYDEVWASLSFDDIVRRGRPLHQRRLANIILAYAQNDTLTGLDIARLSGQCMRRFCRRAQIELS